MKPSIEELQNTNQFKLITEIDIQNPTPFFKEFGKGKFIFFYLFTLFLVAGYLGGAIGAKIAQSEILWDNALIQFTTAIGFMFIILLPIHEGIHAITFWLKGAKDVRFSMAKKGFAVFTIANKHIVKLNEYPVLALMPFIVITLILTILAYIFSAYLVFFSILIAIHSFACMGDMILVNFAINHWNQRIYNYDDFDQKRSYFFEELDSF